MTRVLRLIISFSLVLLYWTAVGVVAQFPFCVIYLQDYSLADWVRGHFKKEDGEALEKCFENAVSAIELMVDGKINDAMNRYNS